MILGEGQMKEMLRWIEWNLKEETKLLPPFDECPTSNHIFLMNIIVWNCKGALKPSFQSHIRELVRNHSPAILVVMETRVGGERVREITNRLPFYGAIHADTIGYVGVSGCYGTRTRWTSPHYPILNRKFTLWWRYEILTIVGYFLLYMLVLGVPKGTYYGILHWKL